VLPLPVVRRRQQDRRPAPPARLALTAVAPPAWHPGLVWLAKLVAFLVPLVTIGLGTPIVVAVVAVCRRSWGIGALAVVNFLAVAAYLVVVGTGPELSELGSPQDIPTYLVIFYLPLCGAVQGLLLVRAPARGGSALSWCLRVLVGVVPILSLGFATWTVIAYYAVRRRSALLALATAGYLVTPTVVLASIALDPTARTDAGVLAFLLMTVLGVVGAAHAFALDPDRHQSVRLPAAPRLMFRPPPVPPAGAYFPGQPHAPW
jgi:hypothetical protein